MHKTTLPKRKPTRWSEIDYRADGYYFLTICTKNRKHVLSAIVGEGLAPPEVQLTPYGEIAQQQILSIHQRFPSATVTEYVIMPNHIHLILALQNTGGASPFPTVSDIICAFKSLTSRLCNQQNHIGTLFQRSFHDHAIRNGRELKEIANYMAQNPQNWQEDCLFGEGNHFPKLAPNALPL